MVRRLVAYAVVLFIAGIAHADWEVKRSDFDPVLISRYRRMVSQNPEDLGTLKKLLSLYRKRGREVQLTTELEAQAKKSGRVEDELVLAHLVRERGDLTSAVAHYEGILKKNSNEPRALAALADLYVRLKQAEAARALYDRALARASDRKPLLRKAADLALNSPNISKEEALESARPYFVELLNLSPNDEDLRREWVEALAARGHADEAVTALKPLIARGGKDPAKVAANYKRLGELEELAEHEAAAISAYREVILRVPEGHYLRREAIERLIEVHRRKDQLRSLLAEWEQSWKHRGFIEWDALSRLYDELGQAAKAEEAFLRALDADRAALDTRKRLIALYEREGRTKEVIEQYRKLISSAPGEPRYRFELAERLWKEPDGEKEALSLCAALGKMTSDPSVHSSLAELYMRHGRSDLALAEREKLVHLEPNEDAHLVELGELHYQRGHKEKAVEIWRRLLTHGGKKETQMARLADVLSEHDFPGEALELYQKALRAQPDDLALKKGLANAFERMRRNDEAIRCWLELHERAIATQQKSLITEARGRILSLYGKNGRLGVEVNEFRRRFEAATEKTQIAAYGLLVTDALVKLGRLDEADEFLKRMLTRAESDEAKADVWLARAQVRRARRQIREVVNALEEAVKLAPDRAKEIYPQIADLSLQLYEDADALTYAKKAVQLQPAQASVHQRLGEVLEKRDQIAEAAKEYERALEIDPRQWRLYFSVARLELRLGQHQKAARRYRDVVRRAPDEELVVDAARRAIELEEYLGSLNELERDLGPLAAAQPEKRVYRNLLVDLYDRLVTPLAVVAHRGDARAHKELARIGEHALRPLLDALSDADGQERLRAALLLGEVKNHSAAEPLFKLALSSVVNQPVRMTVNTAARGSIELRMAAGFSAARLAEPTAGDLAWLNRFAASPEKQLRVSAMLGAGRLKTAATETILQKGLNDTSPDVSAAACLGFLQRVSHNNLPRMTQLAKDRSRLDVVRSACALALGFSAAQAGKKDISEARSVLLAIMQEGADDPQVSAALALSLLPPTIDDDRSALFHAYFSQQENLRQAAWIALTRDRNATLGAWEPSFSSAGLDLGGWIGHLQHLFDESPRQPVPLPSVEIAAAAISQGLGKHRDIALRTLEDLASRDSGLGLGALTSGTLSEADTKQLVAIAEHIVPALITVTHHTDPVLRSHSARVLGKIERGSARLIEVLSDLDPQVRLAALEALASQPLESSDQKQQLEKGFLAMLRSRSWDERRQSLISARAFRQALPQVLRQESVRSEIQKAMRDPNHFVREAASTLNNTGLGLP